MSKITIEQKLNLTKEARKLLSQKEARNKAISIGIGLVATIVGWQVDKQLEKKLVDEFAPTPPEEDTIQGEVVN